MTTESAPASKPLTAAKVRDADEPDPMTLAVLAQSAPGLLSHAAVETLQRGVLALSAELERLREPPRDLYPEWTGAVLSLLEVPDGEKVLRLMHAVEKRLAEKSALLSEAALTIETLAGTAAHLRFIDSDADYRSFAARCRREAEGETENA